MSVVAPSGERAELDRPPTVDEVWAHAFETWAVTGSPPKPNRLRLRNLAILMLYNDNWTQPNLAALFGLTQGRISQLLGEVTAELRISYTKHAHQRKSLPEFVQRVFPFNEER